MARVLPSEVTAVPKEGVVPAAAKKAALESVVPPATIVPRLSPNLSAMFLSTVPSLSPGATTFHGRTVVGSLIPASCKHTSNHSGHFRSRTSYPSLRQLCQSLCMGEVCPVRSMEM